MSRVVRILEGGLKFTTGAILVSLLPSLCLSSSRPERIVPNTDEVAAQIIPGIIPTPQQRSSDPTLQTPEKIEGVITTPDGHLISRVRVTLVRQQSGKELVDYSDGEGHFSFPSLATGNYEIHLKLKGFEPLMQIVEVKLTEIARLKFTMQLLSIPETITVTATRTEQPLGDIPIQVTVLSGDSIQESAALTVDDLLKQVPSFSLFRRTSSQVSHPTTQGVSLRGIGASGASRTLVLLDGVPHNDPFGNWVYWSKIPKTQIETIEVAEGGLSNLYGSSAMGGVINVFTRKPERRTILLEGQGGMLGTGNLDFFTSHRFGSWGTAVGGSLFRTSGYRLIRKEDRGPVDRAAASRHGTLNWRLDFARGSRITMFHNGRFFEEDRDNGTSLRQNSTREIYLGAGLRGFTPKGNDWGVNVFSHIQTFESSFSKVAPDRASETLALVQDVPSRDVGVNTQWSQQLMNFHRITLGSDIRWIKADNKEDVFLSDGFNIRDRFILGEQLNAGVFLQDLMTPTPRVTLVLGARIDYWRNFSASRVENLNTTGETTATNFPNSSQTTLTPQAGVLFRASDDFILRGAFYQGFRSPTLNELYRPFRVGNVVTNPNENLGPERLIGGETGFNYSIRRNLFWRVTGFWNQLKDSISNVTISATPTLISRQRQNLGVVTYSRNRDRN